MARYDRIMRPPRVRDGVMQEWMDTVTRSLNEIPFFSASSFTGAAGPESRQSAYPGAVVVDIGPDDPPRFWWKQTGSGNTGWQSASTAGNVVSSAGTPAWIRAVGDTNGVLIIGSTSEISYYEVQGTPSSITWTDQGVSTITFLEAGVYAIGVDVKAFVASTVTMDAELNFTLDGSATIYNFFPSGGATMNLRFDRGTARAQSAYHQSIISVLTNATMKPQLNFASRVACSSETSCAFEAIDVTVLAHRISDAV